MRQPFFVALLLLWACFCLPLAAQDRRSLDWHHGSSPYRALFSVDSLGNHPRAGISIIVPVCGLGGADGRDIFCYDQRGRQLLSASLGVATHNSILVLVQAEKASQRIAAYFGSGLRAPAAKFALRPLTCAVYAARDLRNAGWGDLAGRLRSARLAGQVLCERMEQVCNPIDSRSSLLMVMEGNLLIEQAQSQSLFIASDENSFLFLDEALVIDRQGASTVHNSLRGENRQELKLKAGTPSLRLVAVSTSSPITAALGRWHNDKKVAPVPATDFVRFGTTTLTALESRRNIANPAFSYRHLSYMNLPDGAALTETELSTYSGEEASWRFADGVTLKGSKVRRVFATLESCEVEVRCGRVTATGSVMFPEQAPPKRLLSERQQDYRHYEELILGAGLDKLRDRESLEQLLEFFLLTDLHPAQIPLCEALLRGSGGNRAERLQSELRLARAAARDEAEKAIRAYAEVLKDSAQEQRAELVREVIEFVIFRMRDLPLAQEMLQRHARDLRNQEKLRLALQLDIALQSGQLEEARKHYGALLRQRSSRDEQRLATVQGNALAESARRAREENRLLDAMAALRDWEDIAPSSRGDGSFSLERARLFRRRGWFEGALGELNAAILAEPLLPNLPEVEFELAGIYEELGRHGDARALYQKIVREYPLHPLAAKARQKK
jgi:tetratricopeptide (TPR) repeat protein